MFSFEVQVLTFYSKLERSKNVSFLQVLISFISGVRIRDLIPFSSPRASIMGDGIAFTAYQGQIFFVI